MGSDLISQKAQCEFVELNYTSEKQFYYEDIDTTSTLRNIHDQADKDILVINNSILKVTKNEEKNRIK